MQRKHLVSFLFDLLGTCQHLRRNFVICLNLFLQQVICLRELRADLLLLLCKLCLSGVLGLKSVFKISDLVGNARRITLHRVQTLTIQLGFVGQLIQFFDLGDQRIV